MSNYIKTQFDRLGTSEAFRLKVHTMDGETNWFSINAKALQKIKNVLDDCYEEKPDCQHNHKSDIAKSHDAKYCRYCGEKL